MILFAATYTGQCPKHKKGDRKALDKVQLELHFIMTIALEEYNTATLNLTTTPEFTDLSNWRLKVKEGAQTWHYLTTDEERKSWPQTVWDKYHLGLPIVNVPLVLL